MQRLASSQMTRERNQTAWRHWQKGRADLPDALITIATCHGLAVLGIFIIAVLQGYTVRVGCALTSNAPADNVFAAINYTINYRRTMNSWATPARVVVAVGVEGGVAVDL